jgi:hypothetical protein
MAMYSQGDVVEKCIAAGNYLANVVIKRDGPSYPREAHTFKF